MKKVYTGIAIAALIGFASTAFAIEDNCSRPPAPGVPDGKTASKEEMISANQVIKKYVSETEAYIKCVDDAETAAMKDAEKKAEADNKKLTKEDAQKIHEAYVVRHNSAVDALQGIAGQFNQAVRDYKAAAAAASDKDAAKE